jgi:hypothetical protein
MGNTIKKNGYKKKQRKETKKTIKKNKIKTYFGSE